MNLKEDFKQQLKTLSSTLVIMFFVLVTSIIICVLAISNPALFYDGPVEKSYVAAEEDEDKIENGIHVRTGFVDDEGLMTVVNNCTNCHSAKLVTQNRMSKEHWKATIIWMQKTQNLWDLGNNEAVILQYLAKNYAPNKKGRRENLEKIEWYELN